MNSPGPNLPLEIVSGGQTGVDRAALDVAIRLNIPHSGWCPAGRRAEDGVIDARYNLRETESSDYAVRTERNVLDSDATLILAVAKLSGGTLLTRELARRHKKPCHLVRLDKGGLFGDQPSIDATLLWLAEERVRLLNVAGPRESTSPGIGERAKEFLDALFVRIRQLA